MSEAEHSGRKNKLDICDGIILALGIAFIVYPICMVMLGSPVVKLLEIMRERAAEVPVFLRVFFSLAPQFLSFYSLLFLFGLLTVGCTLAARRNKAWAALIMQVVGWIIGVVIVCVFGFWCLVVCAVPDEAALLFAVDGARQLTILVIVGLFIMTSVLISLVVCLKRLKRRSESD